MPASAHEITRADIIPDSEFAEQRKGVLKPGYMADLVVLSADIEKTAPAELHKVRPVTTVCGGKVTYQA